MTLVEVDVTALDKDGRPVTGLSAGDFRITLNGKTQPVRTLSYVQVAEPSVRDVAAPVPGRNEGGHVVVTNAVPAEDPQIVILAIDDLSIPASEGRRMLSAARTFVEGRRADTLVGLTTTSGSVAVNPTLDRAAIMGALRRVVGAFIDPRRLSGGEVPLIGIGEALEIAGYNNTSVLNTAVARECLDGGRALVTGEYGAYNTAIGNFNSKCASDIATAARLTTSLVQGTARQQISALTSVLDAMREAPGLKQMFVLTQGVAGTRSLTTLFAPVATAAATAGVQLAILIEDDEEVDLSSQNRGNTMLGQLVGGSSVADRKREDRTMFMAGLQTLADLSGGTFERVITNSDGAFRRAALAGSAMYRLGVEVPPDTRAAEAFVVGAAVLREGVTLRVNRRTAVSTGAAESSPAAKVAAAIKIGTPYYAVPMRVGVARRRAVNDRIELELDVHVPASVPGPLRLTIGAVDEHGALKQGSQVVPVPEGRVDYRVGVTMSVGTGLSRVRLALEDRAGSVGSVNTEVDARLNAMGPVNTSDLLTWWKDASGRRQPLALEDLPAGVTTFVAGMELYPIEGVTVPKDLTVHLSILPAGSSSPVAEVDLPAKADGPLRRAEAALPVANLPPGLYALRATVSGDGQRLGDVSTTIRISPR